MSRLGLAAHAPQLMRFALQVTAILTVPSPKLLCLSDWRTNSMNQSEIPAQSPAVKVHFPEQSKVHPPPGQVQTPDERQVLDLQPAGAAPRSQEKDPFLCRAVDVQSFPTDDPS